MKFVTHSRNDNRTPTEAVQITQSLEIALWRKIASEGRQRIHWAISRVNPTDGDSFRLMKVEHILEFPVALGTLAGALAKATSAVEPELREKLRVFEQLMLDVDERMNANGHSNEKTEAGERLLEP